MIQVFEVPLPVSANRMYGGRASKGRPFPTSDYKAFVDALGWYVKMQRVSQQPSPFRFELMIRGGKGWRVSADIDNRIKPTLDALQKLGIIEGDDVRYVPQKTLTYRERPSRSAEVRCFVRLSPLESTTWDDFELPAAIIE